MPHEVLEAEITWTGDRFERGIRVELDGAGRIAAVGRLAAEPTRRLPRRALLPGFVNAHSHAFQRALRGLGESFPEGAGSFWTWRQAMYGLVEGLDEAAFRRWTLQAFGEMRRAGITTVGEFHYLHHAGELDFRFDELVLEAAAAAGIRLVLLEAYYRTGGVGRPLEGAQRRFATPSPEAYWRRMDELAAATAAAGASLGAVVHSVRAADPDELAEIAAEATARGLVLHLHLEEQRQEIADARQAWGTTPMGLLLDRVEVGPHLTAVHCTHTRPEELRAYLDRGARVCVCPLTEADLGDGLPALGEAEADPASLALGTDSNLRISMLEEMRWLEHGQRLRGERRGVL
ncbi:MAG: amidohydrolase family protein, partial [Thermoanaerobaculia bacterium]|nr:amidohydrolase family protein [Thermoanaerobaculia bacterium]